MTPLLHLFAPPMLWRHHYHLLIITCRLSTFTPARRSLLEKTAETIRALDEFLKTSHFDTLGDFLAILFFNRIHGESDPRGVTHANAVARFLQGSSAMKMADILILIYGLATPSLSKDPFVLTSGI